MNRDSLINIGKTFGLGWGRPHVFDENFLSTIPETKC